jgi:hypothetical protein
VNGQGRGGRGGGVHELFRSAILENAFKLLEIISTDAGFTDVIIDLALIFILKTFNAVRDILYLLHPKNRQDKRLY